MDEDVTIGELYAALRMGVLRFYLSTKRLSNKYDKEYGGEKIAVVNNTQHALK